MFSYIYEYLPIYTIQYVYTCLYVLYSVQDMQASAYECTVYTVPAFVYKPIFFM